VRGVNWLGDAVMSIPALVRLREALSGTEITLLTAEKLQDLWQGHPSIDRVIPFSKQQGVGHVSSALREGKYDTALVLPNSFRSAFEAWLAGVPVRVGYGRRFLLTHSISPSREHVSMRKRSDTEIRRLVEKSPERPRDTFPATAHHLHQYLRLVSFFGASEEPSRPTLPVSEPERSGFRQEFGIADDRLIIGLNPGAEYGPAKRWPAEQFVAAARHVSKQVKAQWLLFGGAPDLPTAQQIERGLLESGALVINVAGRTTLRELMAGLSLCKAVLTNDTGPMHLAAAVGTRVVVPFGSTSPELTGPGLPGDTRHRLLLGKAPCAPCFLRVCPVDFRCMNGITAELVAQALMEAVLKD
jgi:heptosyltransferase-2